MSWPLVKLGELADILSGYAFKSSLFNTDNVGLPLIRIRDVVDGKSDTFYSGEYSREFLIDDGDLLIGMDGDFNREVWGGGQALLNQRVCKITANGADLDQRYLYHFLPKELLRIHASTPAVTVKHLSVKVLRDIDVPLPSLEEQKRIAAILDKADAIRRKRQKAIKLADDFLRSVFLEMFGDPVTNPKGWEVRPLRNGITSIKSGWSAKGESQPCKSGQLGVLKISAVTSGVFKSSENKYVSDDEIENGKKLIFPKKGDLLFSRANTRELVAATCIVPDDVDNVFLPDKLWLIDTNRERLLPEFLHCMIWHPKFKDTLTSQATGTSGSMLNISMGKFELTSSIFPAVEKQKAFGEIYWKVQHTFKLIGDSDSLNANAFASLSQKAFSGIF